MNDYHRGDSKTNAGTYTIDWTFEGNNNYKSTSGTATLTIDKATPTVHIETKDSPYTYDGDQHPATATVAGVVVTVDDAFDTHLEDIGLTYHYVQLNADGTTTDLYDTAPTEGGTYKVTVTFAGSTNYASASASITFTIDPAAPTLSVTDEGGPADHTQYPATGSAVGVDGKPFITGLDENGDLLPGAVGYFTYEYFAGIQNLGLIPVGSKAPKQPGVYTVKATFHSCDPSYSDGTAWTTFVISHPPPFRRAQ